MLSLLLAVLASAAFATLPLVSETTQSAVVTTSDGTASSTTEPSTTTETRRRSLVQDQGAGILVYLAVPVAVAAVPVALGGTRFARAARTGAAAVLGLLALIAIASLGLFYLPSVAAMVAAAIARPSRRAA